MEYENKKHEELISIIKEYELENSRLKESYEKNKDKLKEDEELFTKIFAASSDAIYITRFRDGYLEYINNQFTKVTGYGQDDVKKKSTLEINLWVDSELRKKFTDSLKKTGSYDDYEIQFRRKDGSIFPAHLSAKYIILNGTAHIINVLHDLTETKRTKELLKESEEKYKLLVDNAIETIAVICEGYIKFCNPKAESLTGFSINELLTRPFMDFVYQEDRAFIEDRYKRRIAGESLENRFQFRMLRKDKDIIWVEINSAKIHWEGKEAVLSLIYDINQRKLAETALQESEAFYRSFLSASPDDVTITDLEGRVRMISPRGVAMFRYDSLKKLIGHNVTEYLIEQDKERARKNIELMFSGVFTGPGEYKAIRADGSIFNIEANAEFILGPNDVPTGIVFIIRDITKRKQNEEAIKKLNESLQISNNIINANLEQKNALIKELTQIQSKLEKTNSEKDKFFSIIAHDLRSPFQGFLGMTKALTQDISQFTLAELTQIYSELDKSAVNLYKLLENLLEWAEMQKGAASFTPAEHNLLNITLQCVQTIYQRAGQKKIKMINNIPEDFNIYADEKMLTTVIRNLLSNAVKFTHTGGTITINAKEADADMIEVSIKDNGIGMEQEHLEKLFRIDQKVRCAGTEGEMGTGLGLLLCKEFITKNHGDIWAESEINNGSTFFFTLKKAASGQDVFSGKEEE